MAALRDFALALTFIFALALNIFRALALAQIAQHWLPRSVYKLFQLLMNIPKQDCYKLVSH
jgi:hypothetical protein